MSDSALVKLETAVFNSQKYRHISPELVRRIGSEELAKRPRLKEATKATKNRLHQIGGAYLDSQPKYGRLFSQLQESATKTRFLTPLDTNLTTETEFLTTCRTIMQQHSSTRERLPILDDFYSTIFADLPPIHSVMDIASGFNPLARAWMPLAAHASYTAYDIYGDMMAFLQDSMRLMVDAADAPAQIAAQRDVIGQPPTERVQLALILKTLPVLEMVDKTAVTRLLDTLQADYLLISFPTRSLSGRGKGMVQNYERLFMEWAAGRDWQSQRYLFDGELAFLVETAVSRP